MKHNPVNLHHLDAVRRLPATTAASPGDNVHQRQTEDVYAQSRTITAWQQIYDQVSPGHFNGELQEILLDGIQLCHEYTSLALRQSCMVWPDSFWFGIPARHVGTGFIGSHPISNNAIAVSPGGKEFELNTPDDYAILGVVVSRDELLQYTDVLEQPEHLTRLLAQSATLLVEPRRREIFWSFVREALWYGGHEPQRLRHSNAVKVLKHNLLTTVISFLESAQPAVAGTAHTDKRIGYRSLIGHAREYVLSQQSEPVTVLDLCRRLHVSRRTLQNAFCDVMGCGPNAWLKMIRLNAVRRELVSPYSRHRTVQDAAMQWGFWHLSQFACDYQRLFDEKPSVTLKSRLAG
ncbi:HTH-type transcriptional regulator EutR [Dickeya dianthicola]|uniref:HTH-type transcriptional regulator EutR n=1 Tax=Dickeya dianthicola TaxID=204039 RepID=UPI001F600902|nr:HTH-type transcriptional regulator EutR [Dickeya dianthicola]MCI4204946.1 HTH-type transcriptional regulator EutR [Dickeya dianthicola]MCI4212089.1 HTH-type transcriptional regulator EutR [Dickeya dianthicola]